MFRHMGRLYEADCHIFHLFNQKNQLLKGMRMITHAGGARFTTITTLFVCLFSSGLIQKTAFSAFLSLVFSHLIVVLIKRFLPRNRPYLVLPNAFVVENPFKDHSFPSGHTTAIFSASFPFMTVYPSLIVPLLLLACLVGLSRIVLGLHYPSDVLAGATIGMLFGWLSLLLITNILGY